MPTHRITRSPATVESFILRVIELRTQRVDTIFELHPIPGGEPKRFTSLAALRRFLARAAAREP
jgi:hypothetical protein